MRKVEEWKLFFFPSQYEEVSFLLRDRIQWLYYFAVWWACFATNVKGDGRDVGYVAYKMGFVERKSYSSSSTRETRKDSYYFIWMIICRDTDLASPETKRYEWCNINRWTYSRYSDADNFRLGEYLANFGHLNEINECVTSLMTTTCARSFCEV